jgi:hypothetical protein
MCVCAMSCWCEVHCVVCVLGRQGGRVVRAWCSLCAGVLWSVLPAVTLCSECVVMYVARCAAGDAAIVCVVSVGHNMIGAQRCAALSAALHLVPQLTSLGYVQHGGGLV